MRQVTVVIPAYNPGAFLDEAVQSVVAQSFKDWECVVVDDGSQEDLSRFDTFHPQVRRLRQDNRGLSIARNAGILGSQSEYVAFLDADDAWNADKLKLQVQVMDAAPEAAFCHSAFEIIDAQSRVTDAGWGKPVSSYLELLESSHVCVSTVMVRRSCLATSGLFDPLLRSTQDYDMWLKLARFHEVRFLSDSLAFYRVHGSNMSGNTKVMVGEIEQILGRHKRISLSKRDKNAFRLAGLNARQVRANGGGEAFNKARTALRARDLTGLRQNLTLALQLAPFYTVTATLSYLSEQLKRRPS